MRKVGITGNIGSGKSLVCSIFEKLHIPVFYADQQAKFLYQDLGVKKQMILCFGSKIYMKNGTLNKDLLTDMIFHDSSAMKKLQEILYPALHNQFITWHHQYSAKSSYCLYEAAILFETGFYKNFDHLIFVSAPEHIRMDRVQKRDKLSEKDIRIRMDQQWPESKKIPYCDFIILNDGMQMLIPQVLRIHHQLNKA